MPVDEAYERETAPRFAGLMRASSRDIAVTMPIVALLRAAITMPSAQRG